MKEGRPERSAFFHSDAFQATAAAAAAAAASAHMKWKLFVVVMPFLPLFPSHDIYHHAALHPPLLPVRHTVLEPNGGCQTRGPTDTDITWVCFKNQNALLSQEKHVVWYKLPWALSQTWTQTAFKDTMPSSLSLMNFCWTQNNDSESVHLSVWVCRDGHQLQIAQNEFASPKHRSSQSFYGSAFGDRQARVYFDTHTILSGRSSQKHCWRWADL